MSVVFLSCLKGVKDPFQAQEEKCDFSRDAAAEKSSSRVEGRIFWFFFELWQQSGFPLELQWEPNGPARGASGMSSVHASCEGTLGIPLQFLSGTRSTSGIEAGTS